MIDESYNCFFYYGLNYTIRWVIVSHSMVKILFLIFYGFSMVSFCVNRADRNYFLE